MGWFHDVVASVQHVVNQTVAPVGNLFNGNTALTRALVNPADPVAVGQVFDNTAIKGQTPQTQAKSVLVTSGNLVDKVGAYHQDLWNAITDALHWVGHNLSAVKRSIYRFVRVKGNKVGDNIHSTVNKWGGERRVVAWALVVIVVIVVIIIEIVTWGSATPAIGPGGWAIITALLSYGTQQGLTPDPPSGVRSLSLFTRGDNIDNSKITSIDDRTGGSGSDSSPSFLQSLADSLAGIHPALLVGGAAIAVLGVFYLLKK